MTTTLSSKGQIVLPRLARAKLHLVPGTKLVCEVKGDTIILKAESPPSAPKKMVTDEVSGLKVTQRTKGGATVTSDIVKSILANFP